MKNQIQLSEPGDLRKNHNLLQTLPSIMQKLLEIWREQFYTSLLKDLVLLIVLIVSVKNRKKFKLLKYFPIYTLFLLVTSLLSYVYYLSKEAGFHPALFLGMVGYIDYFFTLLEMIIFSHFYYRLTLKYALKTFITAGNIIFLSFFVYMAVTDKYFPPSISEHTQSIIYTVEGIFLLIICLSYFAGLTTRSNRLHLKNDPVFWISTGLLFFMTCTLPYSLLENYIDKNYAEFSRVWYLVFHVFYCVLFLLIARAYLCKPEYD